MSAAAEAGLGLVVSVSSLVPVVIIARRRQLRASSMYQVLASMAVAETVVGALSATIGSLKLLDALPPAWLCVVGVFLRSSTATSTVVCFLALSVERYVTVVHGLRYFVLMTDTRRRILLAAQWICTALFFLFGVSLRLALGVGSSAQMCDHWFSIPPAYRLTTSAFVMVTYTTSMVINVLIGWAGVRQGRRIQQQADSVLRRANSARLFRHRGYYVLLVMSLMFLVLIVPNVVVNVLQATGLARLDTAHRVTTFMRLFSMITDGWVLALLCPKMKVEPVTAAQRQIPVLPSKEPRRYVLASRMTNIIRSTAETTGHADPLILKVRLSERSLTSSGRMPDVEI
ncbi:Melanocyte-stimulating hormone receptor [Amphibalanus amphitrite]|uniref:Melanocyte-stimulating hormone receptor n=1 Tax=Amphibalanus amphitrite TaxID=1232801 RepID=A0A6A4WNM2_AMPAM|nr:melanocyte-stimulating hormone receptor-like [Amphibalanus amphitrite]XP_043245209.1 melanocyte-stimulating hormone receptor-like [Amphibalanus amphitrite]KAF0305404.1 Melanocyte-stimulating hormone receptor [Amphibalanus amphitrite]